MARDWGKAPWEIVQEEYNAGCYFVWEQRYLLYENLKSEKQQRDLGEMRNNHG